MADKEYATPVSMLENGQLLSAYGSNYLLTVNPALDIFKVRFSLVKIGSAGKEKSDFYLALDKFHLLCQEIDNHIAAKKIAADTGNYPTAYQFTTGKDGCKKLVIGGGQKGVRVQITIKSDSGTDRKMTVCQLDDLKLMSFYYKLITGLTPVSENSFYASYKKAFFKHEEDRKKFVTYNEEEDASAETPVEDEAHEKKTSETPVPTSAEKKQVSYFFKSTGPFEERGGHYFLPVSIEETGETGTLGFSSKVIPTLGVFEDIKKEVDSGTSIRCKFVANQNGQNFTVISLA